MACLASNLSLSTATLAVLAGKLTKTSFAPGCSERISFTFAPHPSGHIISGTLNSTVGAPLLLNDACVTAAASTVGDLATCSLQPARSTRPKQIDVTRIMIIPFRFYYYVLATTGNSSGFSAAIARISSVIFIEQYFGPHILQKWALLKVSAG